MLCCRFWRIKMTIQHENNSISVGIGTTIILMRFFQVEIADCMQTLFRGNSLASKIMAYCFKIYGHGYLRELLNSLVTEMFIAAEKLALSYEVDPARSVFLLYTVLL